MVRKIFSEKTRRVPIEDAGQERPCEKTRKNSFFLHVFLSVPKHENSEADFEILRTLLEGILYEDKKVHTFPEQNRKNRSQNALQNDDSEHLKRAPKNRVFSLGLSCLASSIRRPLRKTLRSFFKITEKNM